MPLFPKFKRALKAVIHIHLPTDNTRAIVIHAACSVGDVPTRCQEQVVNDPPAGFPG